MWCENFLTRVKTHRQENILQWPWGKLCQKQKNAQNEGVGVACAVNLALTSGHCLSQKSVLQNMQWDAKIFTLSTPENSIGVFIYTRSLRVMDAIMCQLLKNNSQTFGHVPRFAVSQILPHALMLSYNDWQAFQNKSRRLRFLIKCIPCLSMNSQEGRKLVLLVQHAVVEIAFMMSQRALILHPVSWQHPRTGDSFPLYRHPLSCLVLPPSRHVEGQTIS